jgi:hypothetical protein
MMNKHTAFVPQIFVLFGTGAVSPPPPPTKWREGGLIGPPRDIRYFSIYYLHNKLLDCWCSA